MDLFLVSRTDSYGYDEYDSFVVAANNHTQARMMCRDVAGGNSWPKEDLIKSKIIGIYKHNTPKIILASFNA